MSTFAKTTDKQLKGNPDIAQHGFKKGQSGNPNGRPKKIPELDKLLAEVLGEEKNGLTAAQAILKALLAKAAKGDVRAAEVLLDRAYGKAKQQMDVNALITQFPAPVIEMPSE